MNIKLQIDKDLKQAMLSGDKHLTTTLRGIKSAILYAEVAKNARQDGLPEAEIISVLASESKKRQESADMYTQGGSQDKADQELAEKKYIAKYLPVQMTEAEIKDLVSLVIAKLEAQDMSAMGRVMTEVKQQAGASADGSIVAQIVKQKLSQ